MSQSEAPDSQPSGILLENETLDTSHVGVAKQIPSEAAGAATMQAFEPLAEVDTPDVDVAEAVAVASTAMADATMADATMADATMADATMADATMADTLPTDSAVSEAVPEAAPDNGSPEAVSEDVPASTTAMFERLLAVLQARAQDWTQSIQFPPSPRAIRLLVAVCSALLLLALLPTLLNANRHPAGATSAPPTATLVPTATSLPSPTAMAGYLPLVDSADGFVIQYPLAWTCATSNPGIDCIDSPSAQNYRLQVQLPGGWTGADTGKDPGDASVWVDYALSAFSDVPGRTYQRLSDANQPAVIGGVVWQGGAAVVGIEPDDGSSDATATPTPPLALIRVQVYATLYNNRPYIIALYAANDQFGAGSARYFQPMLNSFAFLPTNHDS